MNTRYKFVRPVFGEPRRRGAIAVMAAFVMVAILTLVGFLLSLNYIEMANSELQAATDAVARSAMIQLVVTQSESQAITAAQDIASRQTVGGKPFALKSSDIVFGNNAVQPDGSFLFTASGTPKNAVQIQGLKTSTSAAGALDLPFGSFVGVKQFNTQRSGTAMRLDYDIVLVLDRSGSMGWDLSQIRFSYPSSNMQRPVLENYFSPPDPTGSRWAVLSSSVDQFLSIISSRQVSAKVGLVTFASDYSFGVFTSSKVTRDSDFTSNFTTITNALNTIAAKPVIGDTDISAGLLEAQSLLTTSSLARKKTASPVIVLFTDGLYTQGADPVTTAEALYNDYGIIIHCVTFGAEPGFQQVMDNVAEVAGKGLSLHANTAAELVSSFEKIGNAIPVIITK